MSQNPEPAPRTLEFPRSPRALPLVLRILASRSRLPRPGETPPALRVVVGEHEIRTSELRACRRLCGFSEAAGDDGEAPLVPLPHFFISGFRAQVALVADAAFPPSPLGMVHLRNRFSMSHEVHGGDRLRIEASLRDWRQVRTGWEVDVETTFEASSGPSAGKIVARSTSTSLVRGGGTGAPEKAPQQKAAEEGEVRRRAPEEGDWQQLESWELAADSGRRYARVSGDYNPIHLRTWTARLLGYRRPIAHGLYLVSRATAALERLEGAPIREMEVHFKTPAFLPGACHLHHSAVGGSRFELWNGDGSKPHLFGSYEPPSA